MDTTSIATNVDSAGVIIAIVALVVLIWQNFIAKSAAEAQSTLAVWEFLLAEEYRKAREHVIQKLTKKSRKKWNKDDRYWADKVCSSYASAGSLMRKKFLRKELFLDDWGPSIKRNYQILEEHLKERQKDMGDRYWSGFDWAYKEVRQWEKRHVESK